MSDPEGTRIPDLRFRNQQRPPASFGPQRQDGAGEVQAGLDLSQGRHNRKPNARTGRRLGRGTILKDRLLAFSIPEPNTGCWLWLGSLQRHGYGLVWDGRRKTQAHRASHEVFKGPIPEGLQIDHLCRVRCCINPDHLEAVTARTNTLRSQSPSALNAKKTHCDRGHALDGDNLLVWEGDGHRRCRTCMALKSREHYERNREAVIARTRARKLARRSA